MTDEKSRPSLLDAIRTKTVRGEIEESLPHGLRVTTAYARRFVVIAVAAGILIWLVIQLKLLVVPLLVAILVTALLWPVFTWMLRHGVPRWAAIVMSVIGTIARVLELRQEPTIATTLFMSANFCAPAAACLPAR